MKRHALLMTSIVLTVTLCASAAAAVRHDFSEIDRKANALPANIRSLKELGRRVRAISDPNPLPHCSLLAAS